MTDRFALPYEPRPADFVARVGRRPAAIGRVRARRHAGRRGLALLAAFAVPAMAAPEQWRAFEIGNAGEAALVLQPMPFEKPGDSFPGSAFYYLAADDQKAYWTLGESQWQQSDFPPLPLMLCPIPRPAD